MSYCRFGSDRNLSNVYCYLSEDGYVVHVASARVKEPSPELPYGASNELIQQWMDEFHRWMDEVEQEPIGGPYDGTTHAFDTPGETAEFLKTLRESGYHVPQDAIDELEREARSAV
jgi:hypothetical protein